ncbi:MAG: hypothetical protein Fur0010_01440 [Bdellovibrio sp.]
MEFQNNNQFSSDSSAIGSERLRRAIERNRQKQMKRMYKDAVEIKSATSTGPASPQQTWTPPPRKETIVESTAVVPTRRTIGKPEELDFLDRPITRTRARATSVNYPVTKTTSRATSKTTTKRATSRSKSSDGPLQIWGMRIGWAFFVFLFLRLIFSNGGIVDYYNKKSLLNNQLSELETIKLENKAILAEIDQLSHDKSYQKRMVREHLGFISSDEFLILFAKE